MVPQACFYTLAVSKNEGSLFEGSFHQDYGVNRAEVYGCFYKLKAVFWLEHISKVSLTTTHIQHG